MLVEKFDNNRIRLKRPAGTKVVQGDFDDPYDPYRVTVGVSQGLISTVAIEAPPADHVRRVWRSLTSSASGERQGGLAGAFGLGQFVIFLRNTNVIATTEICEGADELRSPRLEIVTKKQFKGHDRAVLGSP